MENRRADIACGPRQFLVRRQVRARLELGRRLRTAEQLAAVEAVSLAWSAGGIGPTSSIDLHLPPAGTPLRLNPLLARDGISLKPAWPTPAFAREYANATYLEIDLPREDQLSGRVGDDPLTDDLARRRILLNLPERW